MSAFSPFFLLRSPLPFYISGGRLLNRKTNELSPRSANPATVPDPEMMVSSFGSFRRLTPWADFLCCNCLLPGPVVVILYSSKYRCQETATVVAKCTLVRGPFARAVRRLTCARGWRALRPTMPVPGKLPLGEHEHVRKHRPARDGRAAAAEPGRLVRVGVVLGRRPVSAATPVHHGAAARPACGARPGPRQSRVVWREPELGGWCCIGSR
jgi:hypothetical protein